ncbi:MAG: hypothetical protein JXR03_17205 [Cyclobacteriaceae bacterium]
MKANFIFNPFEKIAGLSALLIGIGMMLTTGLLAGYTGAHFPDFISTLISVTTGWYVPLVEILFIWAVLSILGMLACQIGGSSNYRIIDVMGTIALSRAPYLLAVLAGFISSLEVSPKTLQLIVFPIHLAVIGWSLALLYHALKVSGNLKGKSLWISFTIVCIGTQLITMLLMNKLYLFIL